MAECILDKNKEVERFVLECAAKLNQEGSFNLEYALETVLQMTGDFLSAECTYLFQAEEKSIRNIYEWRKPCGTSFKTRVEACMPVFLRNWNQYFLYHSCVKLECTKKLQIERPDAYEMLRELGLCSIIAVPLRIENHLLGFLGVDNYSLENQVDLSFVLYSIAKSIAIVLRSQHTQED